MLDQAFPQTRGLRDFAAPTGAIVIRKWPVCRC